MRHVVPVGVLLAFLSVAPARADVPSFQIVMKSNQFVPSEVQIPAGVKVKLLVRNDNQTPSEFESSQFHREKIVGPGQKDHRVCRAARCRPSRSFLTIFIRRRAAT